MILWEDNSVDRRKFISGSLAASALVLSGLRFPGLQDDKIITVNGTIAANSLGPSLSHEHILVEFIGAKEYDPSKWKRSEVIKAILPELEKIKDQGIRTLFDFTPAYLGRDVLLLQELSQRSGLNIITNTGYYGAVDNKYLPESAFESTPEELASIWVKEFNHGIDGSTVKPGFIKISVNKGNLSEMHQKLVQAAAITHLQTGLTIASHTGPAVPAFEQIDLLLKAGVHPSAFIWVHAQNEQNPKKYQEAAAKGAWVSLDGIQQNNVPNYVEKLLFAKEHGFLDQVLISQDAGWYEPGKVWNGPGRSYTNLINHLLPELKLNGFRETDIRQLMETNPQNAFTIRVRKS